MFSDQDLASIVLDHDTVEADAIAWINSHDYHWTEWGFDPYSPVYHPIFEAYNDYLGDNKGIPQTFIIDADGNLRWAKLGMISDNSIMVAILNQLT